MIFFSLPQLHYHLCLALRVGSADLDTKSDTEKKRENCVENQFFGVENLFAADDAKIFNYSMCVRVFYSCLNTHLTSSTCFSILYTAVKLSRKESIEPRGRSFCRDI